MANTYLIDIGINDAMPDIVRKCNHNFRRLATDQSKQGKAGLRQEASRADAVVAGAVDEISDAMSNAIDSIDKKVDGVSDDLDRKIEQLRDMISNLPTSADYAPGVGTYLFSMEDPALTWPGTVWERVKEGTYLVSSGKTLEDGDEVGQNSYALNAAQMPKHHHTGPSHTHSVSGTAASAGSHSHYLGNSIKKGMAVGAIYHDSGSWPTGPYATNINTISGNRTVPGFQYASDIHGHILKTTDSGGAHTHTVTGTAASAGTGSTGDTGGSEKIDNRPQSIAVPLWERTA